jgi:glycosyltransferase involved in cell wall biosynthesis
MSDLSFPQGAPSGAQPAVTVGLPVYNGERFLEQALESFLAQSYDDFELVITDNASTDRTRDICLAYGERDSRLRYLRNDRNLGAAANYNLAFAQARGRYFKWAAHDDAYQAGYLEQCVSTLEANPALAACYSAAVFIDEAGEVIGAEDDPLDYAAERPSERLRRWVMEKEQGWCHPVTGVVRSDVLGKTRLIGPFIGSDVSLVAELLLHGGIARTPERLFCRRDHSGRSVEAHRSTQSRTAWFDTSARRTRAYMPWWRLGIEFSRAVARVPMSPLEKCACAAIMATWFARTRVRLTNELIDWAERGRGPAVPPEQRS